ncbi:MAG: methyltransferase domain-containing protein [Syntrophaceae bacterium]|nr:methyltransferase domain-containing protein [Syntrophaceae bacterium]
MNKGLYVQYGCGWSAHSGWRNFDASPTLRFERLPFIGRLYTKNKTRFPENVKYGDIVKGLPIASDSCNGVYCSHVLEHLSLEDFKVALRNTHKILQPGGIFRFVLPDLEYLIKQYLNNPSDDASLLFMRKSGLGQERRFKNLIDFITAWLGNSQHLWMWDYKSIKSELYAAGFCDIRKAFFGDSPDPLFREVEDRGRWDHCLGIEARKPD